MTTEADLNNSTLGDVTIAWRGDVPWRAELRTNLNRWALVPEAFWAAMQREVRPELWHPFTYLAFLESDYVQDAHNPASTEDSWGVLQVNRRAWPQYSRDELVTFDGNLRAAQAIYDVQGFGAWYNSAQLLNLGTAAPPQPAQPAPAPAPAPVPAPPASGPAGASTVTFELSQIQLLDQALQNAGNAIDAAKALTSPPQPGGGG